MPTAKKNEKEIAVKKDAPIAVKDDTLPASLIGMESAAGSGLEGTTFDDFATPFLAILQKMSPQLDKDTDQYLPGLEVGDLILTHNNQVFKDEDGVDLIFCGYRRAFLRWAPRDAGGGFKGEITVDEVAKLTAAGAIVNEDGKLHANNGDLVRDTRIHYVLVVDADGNATPAVLSCASTQIKKSKMLMTQFQTYKAKTADGESFTPPTFAHIFHAETVGESNDSGNWRGWKFTRKCWNHDSDLVQMAKSMHEDVLKNLVRVDMSHAQIGAATSEEVPF